MRAAMRSRCPVRGRWVRRSLLVVAIAAMPAGDVLAKDPAPAPAPTLGFAVEFSGAGGSEVDSAWERCTGGAAHFEPPGSPSLAVSPLVLRGPLTASRKDVGAAPDEPIPDGARSFRVEIDDAATDVVAVTVEDITIDVRETTTGADWDYRVYGPGDAHYGSITVRSRVGGNSKELREWWLHTSRGGDARKSVSVICYGRDRSEERRYRFRDCLPVSYEPFSFDAAAGATESITLSCAGVELTSQGRRKALCQWINDTVQGKPWKRTVTVKEITKDGAAGRTFNYHDCFPTRYVFPRFSASGTGNLYEEVHIKPVRLELR